MKFFKSIVGFELVIVWFLIGFILLGVAYFNEGFFDAYPKLLLIYYLSWFPVIIIAGLLINQSKTK